MFLFYNNKKLLGTYFYGPSNQGYERDVMSRLDSWRKAQREALGILETETIADLPDEQIKDIKRKHKSSGMHSNQT